MAQHALYLQAILRAINAARGPHAVTAGALDGLEETMQWACMPSYVVGALLSVLLAYVLRILLTQAQSSLVLRVLAAYAAVVTPVVVYCCAARRYMSAARCAMRSSISSS